MGTDLWSGPWSNGRHQEGRLQYWFKGGQASDDPDRLPLVLFHGISPGLCVYLNLIRYATPPYPSTSARSVA
jgi:hypothetical protein